MEGLDKIEVFYPGEEQYKEVYEIEVGEGYSPPKVYENNITVESIFGDDDEEEEKIKNIYPVIMGRKINTHKHIMQKQGLYTENQRHGQRGYSQRQGLYTENQRHGQGRYTENQRHGQRGYSQRQGLYTENQRHGNNGNTQRQGLYTENQRHGQRGYSQRQGRYTENQRHGNNGNTHNRLIKKTVENYSYYYNCLNCKQLWSSLNLVKDCICYNCRDHGIFLFQNMRVFNIHTCSYCGFSHKTFELTKSKYACIKCGKRNETKTKFIKNINTLVWNMENKEDLDRCITSQTKKMFMIL